MGKRRKSEADDGDVAYIHLPGPSRDGKERGETGKEGRCISRIDLWGLELLSLSTLSITQITRSEKWTGREERGGVYDDDDGGIDGLMCPWESRRIAVIRWPQMSQGRLWRGNDGAE